MLNSVVTHAVGGVGAWLRSLVLPYVLLLASLLVGLMMKGGGFLPTPLGRLLAVVVLTCPLFFSVMVFSTLLRSSDDVSGAMAANLLGAMCGGLLEYNAMYFGFQFLYWIALVLYGASFLLCLLSPTEALFRKPLFFASVSTEK